MNKAFLEVLNGKRLNPPPIWLMRQAGRYLPEYRNLRSKAGGFLKLCYTPDFAVDVTMQPIERFGLDAAILFSDILVVPDGLGQKVSFVEGIGPVLEPVRNADDVSNLSINETEDGKFFALSLLDEKKEFLPSLDEVKTKLEVSWKQSKAIEETLNKAGKLSAADDFIKFANENNMKISEVKGVSQNDVSYPRPEIVKTLRCSRSVSYTHLTLPTNREV